MHCHDGGDAYEVEFTTAVLTLGGAEIRPLAGREILHIRELTAT